MYNTIYTIIRVAFELLDCLIIVRVILSWVPHDYRNPLIRFVYEITEPILAPIRKLIPRSAMPIDFSPILAILLLQLAQKLILGLF